MDCFVWLVSGHELFVLFGWFLVINCFATKEPQLAVLSGLPEVGGAARGRAAVTWDRSLPRPALLPQLRSGRSALFPHTPHYALLYTQDTPSLCCTHRTHRHSAVHTGHTVTLLYIGHTVTHAVVHTGHTVTLLYTQDTPSLYCTHRTYRHSVVHTGHTITLLYTQDTPSLCCTHRTHRHSLCCTFCGDRGLSCCLMNTG